MKKEYMKPTMRVVELRQRHHLLNASPGSQASIQMHGGSIGDESEVW